MALDLECRRMAMGAWKRTIRTVGAVAASAGVLAIVLGLLVLAVRPPGGQAAGEVSAEGGPRFREDGPDADSFGRGEGYPICRSSEYAQRQRCRVGAYSHFDQLFPSRTVKAPAAPTRLGRAAVEPAISYTYNRQRQTIDQYLDKHPVTGFLIAKGDSILVERYQYGRTDTQRLTSFSMAKTIVGLLIGIAVSEGAIRSIDERAEVYVPELKGTGYGRTPIKALLQMASGVAFREDYTDRTSDIATLGGPRWARNPAAAWPRSRGSTPATPSRDSSSPTRRRSRWSSVSYSRAPRAARCPTTRARSSGSRSAPKRTRPGALTPRGRRSPSRASTPCCGIGDALDSCLRTRANGQARPSFLANGCSSRRPHASARVPPRTGALRGGLFHDEPRRSPRTSCMAIMCSCSPDQTGSFRCAAFGGNSSSWIRDRSWCWCKPRRARLASRRRSCLHSGPRYDHSSASSTGPAQSRTRRRDGCGGRTYHGLSSLARTRSIRTSSGAIVMTSPSGAGSITSTPHSRSAAAEARALGWFQSGMLAEIATITGVPRPIASATTDSARLSAMPAASLLSEPNEHGATSTSPNGGLGRIASSK